MDLTGHPTDFVVDASFPEGMRRFVRLGRQRWPGMFLSHHAQPLHAATVSGVRASSPEGEAAVEGTGLLLSEYYAVSIVAPEDPDTGPFSRSVVDDFLASFVGPTAAPV